MRCSQESLFDYFKRIHDSMARPWQVEDVDRMVSNTTAGKEIATQIMSVMSDEIKGFERSAGAFRSTLEGTVKIRYQMVARIFRVFARMIEENKSPTTRCFREMEKAMRGQDGEPTRCWFPAADCVAKIANWKR